MAAPANEQPDWELEEWQQALTINVGAAYVCHACGNVVMISRGGVGVMELKCCGEWMERVNAPAGGGGA